MKSLSKKTTPKQSNQQAEEAQTIDVAMAYLQALRKAADRKSDRYKLANGVRITKVTMNYLRALRTEVGRGIDPKTADVKWGYTKVLDPYNDYPDLPEEYRCTGRAYFARSPGTDIWICFDDLPGRTTKKLIKKHSHKLMFPAGLIAR